MLSPGDRLGRYEVVSPLGAGGMGEVYRARDTELQREVALKILPEALSSDPDRLRRSEREARVTAALSHPNVLTVFDVGHEAGRAYLVLEILEGSTLAEVLKDGALRTREALALWKSNPQFSPDGSRFAVESNRDGEADEIWLAAADGSSPTQLTHGLGLSQGSPRWSPDGRRIAFDSLAEDGHWSIWIIDADGGGLRRLTSDPADENLPSWSRDGRFVYFTSNRTGASTSVWRIPAAGGPEELLTRTGGGPAFESVDGKALFLAARRGTGRSLNLYAESSAVLAGLPAENAP